MPVSYGTGGMLKASESLKSGCVRLPPALVALLFCSPLLAQTVPGGLAPGQVEKQFERVPIPDFPTGEFVPGQRDLEPPPGAEGIVFRLDGIRFGGATVIEPKKLQGIAAAYLKRDITLSELYALANRVTAVYRNEGYVLSQAVIPAQELGEDRVAEIRVVEGFVSNVVIEGLDEATRQKVEGYSDHILEHKPLSNEVLERYMLLVNDLTGINGRAVLAPSPIVEGAAELRMVSARDKAAGYLGVTNRGSNFQGPWQAVAQLETDDTLGGYGSLRIFGVTTGGNDELHHLTIARNQYVGSEGTVVSGIFSRTSTKPGAFLARFRIDTDSDNFDLAASHPFKRSRTRNLTGRVRLSVYKGTSKRLDVPDDGVGDLVVRETEDEIRSLRFGLSYDWVDRYLGVNIIDAELSQGLDILGASETPSPDRSRPLGDAQYTKVTAYAARVQQISGGWSLLGSLFGQYGADPLLTAEQCGVGGPNYARAYDQSEIIGDTCVMGLLELRYTREPSSSWLDDYVAYLFVDGGKVDRRSPGLLEQDKANRHSWGGGIRFRIKRRWSGYAEVAVPIDDPVAAEMSDDPRFFMALTGEF